MQMQDVLINNLNPHKERCMDCGLYKNIKVKGSYYSLFLNKFWCADCKGKYNGTEQVGRYTKQVRPGKD